MEQQDFINLAIALACSIGGWFCRIMWQSVKDLQKDLKQVEIVIAGQYVTRVEMTKNQDEIIKRLDKINDKLDEKADKIK